MATLNRYFVRCTGCLEIASIEQSVPYGLKCGICGSSVETMGRVQPGNEKTGDRLVHDHVKCVCDARCTGARGPWCSCQCGGLNHGIGMAGFIHYSTDAGAVPTLQARTPEIEAAARARFAEYQQVLAPLVAEVKAITDRKYAGQFLPRPVFDRMLTLQRTIQDANKAKLHGTRMKKLQALAAAKPVDVPVPTPVVAPKPVEVKGPAPEGRVTVTGEILSIQARESQYGVVNKMLVKLPNGSKIWSTLPAKADASRGDSITFTASFEVSKDDASFAFASRPSLISVQKAVAAATV